MVRNFAPPCGLPPVVPRLPCATAVVAIVAEPAPIEEVPPIHDTFRVETCVIGERPDNVSQRPPSYRGRWMAEQTKILGIDFTSAPRRAKPIVCISAVL
jgi:hypothetical protein